MEDKSEEKGNEFIAEGIEDQPSEAETESKKSKVSKKWIAIAMLLIFVFVLISSGLFFLQQENPPITDSANEKSVTTTPTLEISKPADSPDFNSIYYGVFNGEGVIFNTTQNAVAVNNDPYFGVVRFATGSAETSSFKDIENPVKILSFDDEPQYNLFALNENKDKIFLDILETAEENKNFPYANTNLYVVDLNDLESKVIYSFEINSGKYENVKGAAHINEVVNEKFAVFDVLGCYGCEPVLAGKLIVNLDTSEERFKKDIGNVEFNLENNTYTYQNLENVVEECPEYLIGSPYCNDDNTMEVKKPRGEFILDTLP